MQLTNQRLLPYQGLHGTRGVCHVRVYEQPGRLPVVIVGSLDDGPGTTPTNAIEMVAAAVQAELFADGREFELVEHWPETIEGQGQPTFMRVHFAHRSRDEDPDDPTHYAGTRARIDGRGERVERGEPISGDFRDPCWEAIPDIVQLVGCEVQVWHAGDYTAQAIGGECGQHLRDNAAELSTTAINGLAAAIEPHG